MWCTWEREHPQEMLAIMLSRVLLSTNLVVWLVFLHSWLKAWYKGWDTIPINQKSGSFLHLHVWRQDQQSAWYISAVSWICGHIIHAPTLENLTLGGPCRRAWKLLGAWCRKPRPAGKVKVERRSRRERKLRSVAAFLWKTDAKCLEWTQRCLLSWAHLPLHPPIICLKCLEQLRAMYHQMSSITVLQSYDW